VMSLFSEDVKRDAKKAMEAFQFDAEGRLMKKVDPPARGVAEGGGALKEFKEYSPPYSRTTMDAPTTPFALYERLGFVLTSGDMTAYLNKDGEVKKKFDFHSSSWKSNPVCRKNATGYALLTGKKSGITAIDIDNPELPHNEKLMELMEDCNMIQRTKKGFHYVYKYDERIAQTTSKTLELDTRNDDGLLYVAPSQYTTPSGEVCSYEWQIEPMDDEELMEMPDEVVEYLTTLDKRFVKSAPVAEVVASVVVPVVEETLSVASDGTYDAIVEELVKKTHKKRFENYDDWLKIGLVCHNEKVPMEVWERETTSKYPSYASGSKRKCADKWRSFKGQKERKISQATLWKWLKEDNYEAFAELMPKRNDFWNLIELLNHKDIAKYFYNINPDAYLWCENLGWYSLMKNNTWRHYEDKRSPCGLKRHLADTLQDLAMDTKKAEIRDYAKKASETMDDKKKDELLKAHKMKISTIHTAYKQFGSSDVCNGTISFLNSFYDDPDLEEKIDMNRYLFAFTDGLYDINTCKFRPISPHDYVSTTTGYAYPKASNATARKDLRTFMYGLFEDEQVSEYLWKVLATCILGYNRFGEYYTFTGSGGNGKGVVAELLTTAFGDYYHSVDVALFTKPVERKDQPLPALVDARPKRLMMTSEPEADDRLQVGLLKKITGGDPVEARTLHSKHIVKYVPQFSVIFQTNSIPQLSKIDGGITRRMRVIKFPFQFRDGTGTHFRKGDPDIKEVKCKSDAWRDEFMLILTELLPSIKDLKEMKPPKSVAEATQNYIDDNNPLKAWLDKHYEITNHEEDFIGSTELKRQFMSDTNREKFADNSFKQLLGFNGITWKHTNQGNGFVGLKRKAVNFEE